MVLQGWREGMLRALVGAARVATDATNATFAAADPVARVAAVEVAAAEPPEGLRHSRFAYAEGLAGHVAAAGAPLVVPDAAASPVFRRLGERPVGAIAAVPVAAGDQLAGVLTVTAERPGAFGPAALDKLAALAAAFAAPLAQAQQAAVLGRLAELAHDLHTPVAALRCLVAQQPAASPLAAWGGLATDQLVALAEEMDDVVRLADGRLVLRRAPTDPRALAAAVVATMEPLADAAGVALRLTAPSELPSVLADRPRLLRLLTNVVANALKHAPSGSIVALTVRAEAGQVAFRVADRGPGPDAGERRTLGGMGGHGLGLSIARQLARAHDGSLELAARPAGGAVATLRLPAIVGGAAATWLAAPRPVAPLAPVAVPA